MNSRRLAALLLVAAAGLIAGVLLERARTTTRPEIGTHTLVRLNDISFVTLNTQTGAARLHVFSESRYRVRDLSAEERALTATAPAAAGP